MVQVIAMHYWAVSLSILLVNQHTTAIYTYTDSQCIYACTNPNAYLKFNIFTCQRCAVDPPITSDMCKYACNYSDQRSPIGLVCGKCYKEKPELMTTICNEECDNGKNNDSRLCENCNTHNNKRIASPRLP